MRTYSRPHRPTRAQLLRRGLPLAFLEAALFISKECKVNHEENTQMWQNDGQRKLIVTEMPYHVYVVVRGITSCS